MSDTKIRTWACVSVVILVAVGFAICIGIIGIRGKLLAEKELEIVRLEEFIDKVKLQSEQDYSELRVKYEKIKKELKYEIEVMAAGDLVDMFFTEGDYNSRTAVIDAILREQFRHFVQLLGEMELEIIRRSEKVIQ